MNDVNEVRETKQDNNESPWPTSVERPKMIWLMAFVLFFDNSIIFRFVKDTFLTEGARVADGGIVQIILITHIMFILYLLRGVFRLDSKPLILSTIIFSGAALWGINGALTGYPNSIIFLILPSVYFIYYINNPAFKKLCTNFRMHREFLEKVKMTTKNIQKNT